MGSLTGSGVDPIIYVIGSHNWVAAAVARVVPGTAEVYGFESPLDLIGACQSRSPLFVVAQVGYDQQTWVTALEVLQEQLDAPRVLYLVEPSMVDEVMSGLFRDGRDHMVLWPADEVTLHAAINRMIAPPSPPVVVPTAHRILPG